MRNLKIVNVDFNNTIQCCIYNLLTAIFYAGSNKPTKVQIIRCFNENLQGINAVLFSPFFFKMLMTKTIETPITIIGA